MRTQFIGHENETAVFTAVVKNETYQKLRVVEVCMMPLDGRNEIIARCDHLLVAQKPFKLAKAKYNDKVRFTGKITTYRRMDGSTDYQVIVNKARII